jgi:hypothetical protein
MTFLTRDGRSRLGSLDRACQPINIRRRRAASDIGAKQTARRILRNAEKSRVELGATVRRTAGQMALAHGSRGKLSSSQA